MLTFSPLGERVNTNMALNHRQVKKSTLGKIVNNHHDFLNNSIQPLAEFVVVAFWKIIFEMDTYYLADLGCVFCFCLLIDYKM